MSSIRLDAEGVVKTYPGVQALRGVSLTFAGGEVHGLVGENGAGKSTLIKALTAAIRPDAGRVVLDGEDVTPDGPRDRERRGVGAIYQELTIVPDASAVDNVFLGRPLCRRGVLRRAAMRARFAELAERIGVALRPEARAGSLSVAEQQVLEIMRALQAERRVLIMDEPTAALGPRERQNLYRIVGSLREQGLAIVFISHELDEVLALSDRVSVLREGALADTRATAEWTKPSLVRSMLGEAPPPAAVRRRREPDEARVLEIEGVSVPGRLHDVSLHVRRGEILGIAGLVGSGRTELLRAIAGIDRVSAGTMKIDSAPVPWPRSARRALSRGIALAPEDRKGQGLVLEMTGTDNVLMSAIGETARSGIRRPRRELARAGELTTPLGFDRGRLSSEARLLSGGNQQKLVVAKQLHVEPKLLLLDEPTRGIDIGAKAELFAAVTHLASQGVAVILVSSDLSEVLDAADRVVVLAAGRVVGELEAGDMNVERVLARIFDVEAAA